MAAREREGLRVHKVSAFPRVDVVALGAIRGEAGERVVRVHGLPVVLQVTRHALGRQHAETALMALRAIQVGMATGQREALGMVESGVSPGIRVVALHAVRREARRRMVGIVGSLIIPEVTT